MNNLETKKSRRVRRKLRIRKKISGNEKKYRLTIYRSLNHIYAQVLDDTLGKTFVSASTLDKDVTDEIKPEMKKIDKSKIVGISIAKKSLEKNIKKVAFDRNGYLYHGRVKALAEAAREGGLEF
jgi:large subunit ribosomal protein L18